MSAGAFLGSIGDAFDIGFRADFIEAASTRLAPGKAAVVAEIGEDWIAPLDMRMQAIGGEVVRQWRSDFGDEQIERLVKESQAEFAELKGFCINALCLPLSSIAIHRRPVGQN
jgi:hypothetical protein